MNVNPLPRAWGPELKELQKKQNPTRRQSPTPSGEEASKDQRMIQLLNCASPPRAAPVTRLTTFTVVVVVVIAFCSEV